MAAWNDDHFADRDSAGRALAERVAVHLGTSAVEGRPLVVALPRGGVPIGARVADLVGGDLDVLVVRKIAAPGRPEFGVGALAAGGEPIFDRETLDQLGLIEDDLADTVRRERAEANRRAERYRPGRPPLDVHDRLVVVVDDGLATGVTARAALRRLRDGGPRRLILAVPVCSVAGRAAMAPEADAVISLMTPARFTAVGRWYADFPQLTDRDVERVLMRPAAARR
ncbi:MAG TPA: phosphoribosyltransferase family protein [Actinoplanes sp.]|nr:phosphoribosyltransferase family protein [Actinoplanes sp.]